MELDKDQLKAAMRIIGGKGGRKTVKLLGKKHFAEIARKRWEKQRGE